MRFGQNLIPQRACVVQRLSPTLRQELYMASLCAHTRDKSHLPLLHAMHMHVFYSILALPLSPFTLSAGCTSLQLINFITHYWLFRVEKYCVQGPKAFQNDWEEWSQKGWKVGGQD